MNGGRRRCTKRMPKVNPNISGDFPSIRFAKTKHFYEVIIHTKDTLKECKLCSQKAGDLLILAKFPA